MTRRVVTRGRKDGAGHRSKPTSRAATRTGKKTASARAVMPAAPVPVPMPVTPKTRAPKPVTPTSDSRKSAPARGRAAGRPDVMTRLDKDAEREREARLDAARKDTAARTEDDEDLDWLTDEEDPRKQIVEDDEDGDPHHHEEW
jgi:hypothetical protein